MWAWLRGKGRVFYEGGEVDCQVPRAELPTRPVDADTYVRQLDDEIADAVAAGDFGLVDELTGERCRILLARGETP